MAEIAATIGLSTAEDGSLVSKEALNAEMVKQQLESIGVIGAAQGQILAMLGLTTAEGGAVAGTNLLTAAFAKLWAIISAHPIGAIITAIGAIAVGTAVAVNATNKIREKARQAAIELTNSYRQEQATLDSQINKYKELTDILDKGNLSANETRSIKEQLLEIQKSLIESYGNEAYNIDLLNGKYREQLGLLSQLSKKTASDYVTENRDAFNDAKKALAKVRTYNLGHVTDWTNANPITEKQQELLDFISSYSTLLDLIPTDLGDSLNYTSSVSLSLKANANDANDLMHQFAEDLDKFGKENNIDVSGILSNISTQLRKTETDELNEYRVIYDEFMKAEVIRSDTLRPLYQQSIQAVEDYNEALASGKGVEKARANLDSVQQSVQKATDELEGSQEIFDNIYDSINKNAETAYTIDQALKNSNTIASYAGQLRGLYDTDLKAINFKDTVQSPGEEAFGKLIELFGLSEEETEVLINKLAELGFVQGKIQDSSTSTSASFSDIFSFQDAEANLTSLGKVSESLGTIQNAYRTLSSAVAEYNDNGTISFDTLQSVISLGDDWLDYLVDEKGALKLDQESLEELTRSRLEHMRVQTLNNLIDQVKQIEDNADANRYLISTNYEASASFEELARTSALAAQNTLLTKVESGDLSQAYYDAVIDKMYGDINKINALFDNTSTNLSGASSAASNTLVSFTDLLDKELAVLDRKMEAGYADFNDYMHNRLALIEDYYQQGRLSADEYYSYLERHYDTQLSYMDKTVNAVTRRIDKEIDGLEKQKDAIEQTYQQQIDSLNEQKTLLEDANKERQRQIDLQKAQYELERAKNQRTTLIYSEDKGMHYVTDESAVKDAQQEVENAKLDIEIAEIDASISRLEEARDTETAAIDAMIEKLEEYKEQWTDISSAYEEEQENLIAAQILGQEWESEILDGRLDVLNQFKDNYIAIQQAMVDAAYQAAQAMANGENATIDDSSKDNYHWEVVDEANASSKSKKFSTQAAAENYAKKMNKQKAAAHHMTLEQFNHSDIPGYYVRKYHTGLLQGPVKQHSFDDDFKLIRRAGLGTEDVPAILKAGEAVATPEQIHNLADSIRQSALPNFLIPLSSGYTFSQAADRISAFPAQQTITQNITLNCPNVTNNSGVEYIQRELGHLSLRALQESVKR